MDRLSSSATYSQVALAIAGTLAVILLTGLMVRAAIAAVTG